MNLVDDVLAHFETTVSSPDESGVTRFSTVNLDLRALATFLMQAGARFVTITATELPRGEGFCLEYLWDSGGHLLNFSFSTAAKTVSSIYDICEAADWIEREIHEEYAIDFVGREYEPLLLRAGDRAGVNLQEVAK